MGDSGSDNVCGCREFLIFYRPDHYMANHDTYLHLSKVHCHYLVILRLFTFDRNFIASLEPLQ